jgi:PAS domain S-box-containing protein
MAGLSVDRGGAMVSQGGHWELLAQLLERLRTARPGFAQVLDALAEAVTIRDPEDRIIFANQAAVERLGFASLEELQRRPPERILADYLVHDEEGREVLMQDIPSVRLLTGEPAPPLVIRTINRRTGQLRWDRLKSALLRDQSETAVAAVTIIEDITAEKTSELRDRFLSQATETLMSSLDYEETLRTVGWLAVPEIADWCAVDLVDERGARLRVVVAHRDPERLALAERLRRFEPERLDPEQGPGRVVRTGISELYPEITDEMLAATARDDEHLEMLRAVGFRSVLLVPLRTRGRTFGVLTLVSAESMRRFGEGERDFAEQLAARAATAVDNARLATARLETARTLQRSLLPNVLPTIPGWQLAASYRPAGPADEIEVGGDFYDFIETTGGWIVLMGDVTGKGIKAAAVTSLVRHGARFIARQENSPGAILSLLNDALIEQRDWWLCSALCMRVHGDEVTLSSAGHPAPLIVRDDRRLHEFAATGPILGAWSDRSWNEYTLKLSSRETILAYTDGVTDARGSRERYGVQRLRRLLAANAKASPPTLIQAVNTELEQFQRDIRTDDTAMVALRRTGDSDAVPAVATTDRGATAE